MVVRHLRLLLLIAAAAMAWFPLSGRCEELPPQATARLGTLQFRHSGGTYALAFSPDGKLLASACRRDFYIYLFDAATGRRIRRISIQPEAGGRHPAYAFAFSPDGKKLAAVSLKGPIHILDVSTGRTVRRIAVERGHVLGEAQLAYSPDGSLLALADGFAWRVLRADNGEILFFDEPRAQIHDLRFSADGRSLIVAGIKPHVAVWGVRSKKRVQTVKVHDATAFSATFSPDGKTGISSSRDVAVWNAEDGKLIRRLSGDVAELFMRVDFAADGKLIVAASQKGPLYVWDAETGERKAKLSANIRPLRTLAVSPDGKRVAACGSGGQRIHLWNVETDRELRADSPGHEEEIEAVAVSPDGKTVLIGSGGRTTHFWNAETGNHAGTLSRPLSSRTAEFSPDGKLLFNAWYGNGVARIMTADGEPVAELRHGNVHLAALRLTSNGQRLVTVAVVPRVAPDLPRKGRLTVWNVATRQKLAEMEQEGFVGRGLAVTRDGRYAATTSRGAVIAL